VHQKAGPNKSAKRWQKGRKKAAKGGKKGGKKVYSRTCLAAVLKPV